MDWQTVANYTGNFLKGGGSFLNSDYWCCYNYI